MLCVNCNIKMDFEIFEEIEWERCGNCEADFLTKAHLHYKCNQCQNCKIEKQKMKHDTSFNCC